MILKGLISTISGNRAQVIVQTQSNRVTTYLFIPEYVGEIKIDDEVAFVEFSDSTGAILCKMG